MLGNFFSLSAFLYESWRRTRKYIYISIIQWCYCVLVGLLPSRDKCFLSHLVELFNGVDSTLTHTNPHTNALTKSIPLIWIAILLLLTITIIIWDYNIIELYIEQLQSLAICCLYRPIGLRSLLRHKIQPPRWYMLSQSGDDKRGMICFQQIFGALLEWYYALVLVYWAYISLSAWIYCTVFSSAGNIFT